MGQEIERARALLSRLTREKVLPPAEAAQAYEAWVAHGEDVPFSRFLLDRRRVDPEVLRRQLRLDAVQGMPHPERFTYERFEDLLVGQLGIEAGLLGAKLLQTVRKVQDKKAGEHKLRRLAELLPRANFDPELLDMLLQHLHERVILCRGCLGRYPRKDAAVVELECPRCGERMRAAPLEPSQSGELPEAQRAALLASSEAVLETIPVQARERPSAARRDAGGSSGAGVIVALAGTALIVLATVGVLLLGRADRGRARAPAERAARPAPPAERSPDPPRSEPVGGPAAAGPTVGEVRRREPALLAAGDLDQLVALWRDVRPAPGEDAQGVASVRLARLEALEQLRGQVARAAELLDQARAAPEDAARWSGLEALLAEAQLDHPVLTEAARALEGWAEQRRAGARRAAEERYAAAWAAVGDAAWARRAERARRAGVLLGVELEGAAGEPVRVVSLGADGFTVQSPKGERRYGWLDHPTLALRVLQAAAGEELGDQRLLLRAALLAKDPLAAREAAARLGAPDVLDPARVLAFAATSASAAPLAGERTRFAFPTAWVGHDLRAADGAELRAIGERLALAGERPRFSGPEVPLAAPSVDGAPFEVAVRAELGGGEQPALGLTLHGPGSARTYVARWGAEGWSLELDLGSGSNPIARGRQVGPPGGRACLRYDGATVTFELEGVALGSARASGRFEAVSLRVEAARGPLEVRSLAIEGDLDPAWRRRSLERYALHVDRALDLAPPPAAALAAPALEEQAPAAARERLAEARAALAGERFERARAALDALAREQAGEPAVVHARAHLALCEGDAWTARSLLEPLVSDEVARAPSFAQAELQALLALALAHGAPTLAARSEALGEAARQARPDLAAVHLARVRRALRAPRAPDAPALDPAALGRELDLALALGRADPLVRREAAALRVATRLRAGSAPSPAGHYALTAAAGDPELAARLDGWAAELARGLGAKTPGRPAVSAAVLAPADHAALADGAGARYDPSSALLLLPAGASALDAPLAEALARAELRTRHGAPPPWLEAGLVAWLAGALQERAQPEGALALLEGRPASASDWAALLAAPARAFAEDPLAKARAWALVELLGPTRARALLRDVRAGELCAGTPPGIVAEQLPNELRALLERRRKG